MELKYIVKENNNYLNINQVLKEEFEISDRLLLKLKNEKAILLNGNIDSVKTLIKPNDIITVSLNFKEDNSNIKPTKMQLKIIYEDDAYIIINKLPNTSVHPSMSHYTDSISNGIKYYFEAHNIHKKIRPVNRLDKDTSRTMSLS